MPVQSWQSVSWGFPLHAVVWLQHASQRTISNTCTVVLVSNPGLRLQTTAQSAFLSPDVAAGAGRAARCAELGGEGGVAAAEAKRKRPGLVFCQGEPRSKPGCAFRSCNSKVSA